MQLYDEHVRRLFCSVANFFIFAHELLINWYWKPTQAIVINKMANIAHELGEYTWILFNLYSQLKWSGAVCVEMFDFQIDTHWLASATGQFELHTKSIKWKIEWQSH